jgi:hypothetical protein
LGEAQQLIASIGDPITKLLVSNAFYHLRKKMSERNLPDRRFDLLFYAELMRAIFSEHYTLRRLLDGMNLASSCGGDQRF